jgi:hypothetical protein
LNARPQPLKSTDEILALKIEKYEELLKSIKEESSIIISEQEKVNKDLANLVNEQLAKAEKNKSKTLEIEESSKSSESSETLKENPEVNSIDVIFLEKMKIEAEQIEFKKKIDLELRSVVSDNFKEKLQVIED